MDCWDWEPRELTELEGKVVDLVVALLEHPNLERRCFQAKAQIAHWEDMGPAGSIVAFEFIRGTLRIATWVPNPPAELASPNDGSSEIHGLERQSKARKPPTGIMRERGTSVVEMSLMLPFILLIFLVLFNFGFYTYAALSTANAARVAALEIAAGGGTLGDACVIVQREMRTLINTPYNEDNNCTFPPLAVGADDSVADADGNRMVTVQVQYETVQMFPLPWMLGKMTFSREIEARYYD